MKGEKKKNNFDEEAKVFIVEKKWENDLKRLMTLCLCLQLIQRLLSLISFDFEKVARTVGYCLVSVVCVAKAVLELLICSTGEQVSQAAGGSHLADRFPWLPRL